METKPDYREEFASIYEKIGETVYNELREQVDSPLLQEMFAQADELSVRVIEDQIRQKENELEELKKSLLLARPGAPVEAQGSETAPDPEMMEEAVDEVDIAGMEAMLAGEEIPAEVTADVGQAEEAGMDAADIEAMLAGEETPAEATAGAGQDEEAGMDAADIEAMLAGEETPAEATAGAGQGEEAGMDAADIEAMLAGEETPAEATEVEEIFAGAQAEPDAAAAVDAETEQLAAELEAMLAGDGAQPEDGAQEAASPELDAFVEEAAIEAVPETETSSVACEACGAENVADDLFCKACGNPMNSEAAAMAQPEQEAGAAGGTDVVVCEQCGTKNRQGDLFCEECGSQLVPASK